MLYHAGDVVWTKYGAGVIVGHRSGGGRDAVATDDNETVSPSPLPVSSEDTTSASYVVRLWRLPGKSIGSAALAYFSEATILERLPAAPGMETTIRKSKQEEGEKGGADGEEELKDSEDEKEEESKKEHEEDTSSVSVLVHAYYHNSKIFLVSPTTVSFNKANQAKTTIKLVADENAASAAASSSNSKGGDGGNGKKEELPPLWKVEASELLTAPSAKFYPILETLMVRGDQTAQQATQFFQSEKTQAFLTKTQETIHSKLVSTTESLAGQEENAESRFKDFAASVEAAVSSNTPSEPQIKQVLSIVKDQELTQLLQNCRERLEHLVNDEIPNATKQALLKTGIQIKLDDDGGADATDAPLSAKATFAASMNASRKAALKAVRELLDQADVDPSQLEQVQADVTQKFSQTFDSLATAAKSDRSLNDLFQSVADKTTVWQQSTGRLLETRSASLFLEGASRLQARAAAIFQMQWTGGGEIGSKLTKAFTEKDAALARLKSIQLGDAVKKRLVEAIEVRSDSLGGLDGIIAGALAKVRTTGQQSGDKMKAMLSNLQASASSATADAHETLISVLSHRSMYRDVALMRIERVFCELETHFGSDLSPEDIAAVARGEGGTAKLFEPIAKKAVQQIEKQLDTAESQIKDKSMLAVLQRVRKITSGELTVAALTEELVGILNDERIVAASETFMQHGEHVLDAIEGVSTNKVVNDALKIAEKAGITKDSMMKQFESLDVDQLLDTAGSAVTDEAKRLQLLSSATDTALDFILRILPSMPVPPFDGARDGLVYNISNLSMEGFKVRKEDIQIELAGMRATKRRSSSIKTTVSLDAEDLEEAAAAVDDETTPDLDQETDGNQDVVAFDQVSSSVKATELLIIDVRRISATLNDAAWGFEQTYMPYLKGSGMANIKLSDGAIRLQFELRRRVKVVSDDPSSNANNDQDSSNSEVEWEPVLCLHDRTCKIGAIELVLQGEGRITWIFNKLASIFKGALRDYVVRTIVRVLTKQSGWILEKMNAILSSYWDLILKTAKLKMEDLVEADDKVVVKADTTEDKMLIELVWRERLPLGMNLLTNDESGQLKVVDFPRGSQARLVCEKQNLTPELFKGATIVAVNGTTSENQDELFDALKDPARPKTIQFRLAESAEWERVRRFVEGDKKPTSDEEDTTKPRDLATRVVEFTKEGELGIVFAPALDNSGLVVNGFLEGDDGIVLAAERSNDIQVGDLLTHVNGKLVVGTKDGTQNSLQTLEEMANDRPLLLTFSPAYAYREVIVKPEDVPGIHNLGGPEELVLAERKLDDGTRRVVIKDFNPVSGAGESSGILIGDHLVFVNGTPVGAGARWLGEAQSPTLDEVYEMLGNNSLYPIGLTFARPQSKSPSSPSRWSSKKTEPFSDFDADTICVTCDQQNRLGCIFDTTEHGDIVISDFSSVPGLFHRHLSRYNDLDGRLQIAIESINGQFVPSYVTKDMVMNALNRSWKNDKCVEIILCDDERKQFILSLT
ncbi:hypothetical protein ACA910_001349 [Epithemia clementina (nom. ined.)]